MCSHRRLIMPHRHYNPILEKHSHLRPPTKQNEASNEINATSYYDSNISRICIRQVNLYSQRLLKIDLVLDSFI